MMMKKTNKVKKKWFRTNFIAIRGISYSKIVEAIHDCPVTFIPGIMREVIERSIDENIFAEGGMQKFIDTVVKEYTGVKEGSPYSKIERGDEDG